MNNDDSDRLIEVAVTRGYIAKSQADLLNEELFMFPGGNVLAIMLRRAMISPEQAKALESGSDADATTATDADLDMDMEHIVNVPLSYSQNESPSKPEPLQPLFASEANISPQNSPSSSVLRAAPPQSFKRPPISAGLQQSMAAVKAPVPAGTIPQPPKVVQGTEGIFPDPQMMRILKAGREQRCSDLHLTVGKPPYFRKEGRIFFLPEAPLTAEVSENLNRSVLTSEQLADLDNDLQLDFSFECGVAGRFRANVYRQRLGLEGAYRFIPGEVPTLASLGLPSVLEKLTTYPQGMNLVTGPGGCGKTSTVAAMLQFINSQRHEHIITVEDPVEYVLHSDRCQITQREVGTHTESFGHALRTALRQDPDVIMIGELRDLETTSISITAAETGHLVFGTLHTASAMRTVARILDVYPPSQRAQICMMVAESLRGIMSQQLVERKDGKGRVCAMEVLLVTTGVAQVIKEGKTHQLVSHMQSGRKLGMISLDDALMELYQSGIISGREAYNRAENKTPFELAKGQS